MNRKNVITIISIIANILLTFFIFYKEESNNSIELIFNEKNEDVIYVDIEGEVNKPGVYKMKHGNRIKDIIIKAKGITDNADIEMIEKNINKAEILVDEQKILIPAKSIETTIESTEKININDASIQDLITLPGIGESYARKIFELKPYSSIDQIKNVPGIGEKTFENIRNLITI